MDSVQIKGVDSTIRDTEADLAKGASIVIHEKIMTHGSQIAKTNFQGRHGMEKAAVQMSYPVRWQKEIPNRSLRL